MWDKVKVTIESSKNYSYIPLFQFHLSAHNIQDSFQLVP